MGEECELIASELVVVEVELGEGGCGAVVVVEAAAEAELVDSGDGVEAQVELEFVGGGCRGGREF